MISNSFITFFTQRRLVIFFALLRTSSVQAHTRRTNHRYSSTRWRLTVGILFLAFWHAMFLQTAWFSITRLSHSILLRRPSLFSCERLSWLCLGPFFSGEDSFDVLPYSATGRIPPKANSKDELSCIFYPLTCKEFWSAYLKAFPHKFPSPMKSEWIVSAHS